MSSQMSDVLVSVIIGVTVVLLTSAIAIPSYLAGLDNNEPALACVDAGGAWLIDEASDHDDPRYECVR